MTRIAMILICLCVLAGGLYWHWQSNQHAIVVEAGRSVEGRIVVATKDIQKGDLFEPSNLEEKEVNQAKIGSDFCTGITALVGRHCNYYIAEGTAISFHDITEADQYLWTEVDLKSLGPKPARPGFTWVVYPIHDVMAGKPIPPGILEMKEIEEDKPAQDAIHAGVEVIGKVAPNGFSQGQIIYKSELAEQKR